MSYLLPFEIVSVHLLVVLIGAAYLARAKRRRQSYRPRPRATTGSVRMTVDVGLNHYLLLGALLFVCGTVCMATKRNAIGILMGVELVLNGATVNFVAFAHYNPAFEVEGRSSPCSSSCWRRPRPPSPWPSSSTSTTTT